MRLFRNVLILTAFLSLLSGCLDFSIYPCYTKDKVIEYPSVVGTWECTDCDMVDIDLGENWQFGEDSIEVVDEEGMRTELTATYFRVGETVFLDTLISELDAPAIAGLHLIPSHFLTRVEMDEEKETLTLTGLDYAYIESTNELPLRRIDEDDIFYSRVFIATPEQWIAFLEKHHDSAELYGGSIVLKRRQTAPPPE